MKTPLVLVIEPNEKLRLWLRQLVEGQGYSAIELNEFDYMGTSLKGIAKTADLVLINLEHPDISSIELMQEAATEGVIAPFIGYTRFENMPLALACMRAGAFDYFSYPIDSKGLMLTLQRAIEDRDMLLQLQGFAAAQLSGVPQTQSDIRYRLAKEIMAKRQAEGKALSKRELMTLMGSTENPALPLSTDFQSLLEDQGLLFSDTVVKETLLIVEDEPIHRENLGLMLGAHYTLISKADLTTAKEALMAHPEIEMMLLDIMLPDGNSLDELADFKRLRPDIEIIMLTGYEISSMAVDAFRLGAYDYINKPFRRADLLFTLSKGIHRKYLKQLLSEMSQEITCSLPQSVREDMARTAFYQHQRMGCPFCVKDLAKYFPELHTKTTDMDREITLNDLSDGLLLFVEMSS